MKKKNRFLKVNLLPFFSASSNTIDLQLDYTETNSKEFGIIFLLEHDFIQNVLMNSTLLYNSEMNAQNCLFTKTTGEKFNKLIKFMIPPTYWFTDGTRSTF